jgi:hypothetical protein
MTCGTRGNTKAAALPLHVTVSQRVGGPWGYIISLFAFFFAQALPATVIAALADLIIYSSRQGFALVSSTYRRFQPNEKTRQSIDSGETHEEQHAADMRPLTSTHVDAT